MELLKLEFQSLVSAANMTRKLDEEAALAEVHIYMKMYIDI